jgi:hypothetical protein
MPSKLMTGRRHFDSLNAFLRQRAHERQRDRRLTFIHHRRVLRYLAPRLGLSKVQPERPPHWGWSMVI